VARPANRGTPASPPPQAVRAVQLVYRKGAKVRLTDRNEGTLMEDVRETDTQVNIDLDGDIEVIDCTAIEGPVT